jgi:predicted nuclease with RNAse H fold
MTTALGIDVGGTRKGYDLVLLDDTRTVQETQRHVALDALRGHIDAWRPDVVCIDSPPAWATGASRQTEAYVLSLGLSLYRTPWTEEAKTKAFYAWMLSGFQAFAAARNAGYAMYDGGASVQGRTLEVFPHAIASVLHGARRPPGLRKHLWRREALSAAGVDETSLKGNDQADAALCALTGLYALEGRFCWAGDPAEGVIVLPCLASELAMRVPWASNRGLAMMASFR